MINELGQTLFERAKVERGEGGKAARDGFLKLAESRFQQTLALDSENVAAHWNLALIYEQIGEAQKAAKHRTLHERYRPDDNARDRAVAIARRANPAADNAAKATVIYPLQRLGAPELAPASRRAGTAESAGGN